MKCSLVFNKEETTWDCPCHGSRFSYSGKNLYDPAFKDLEIYNLEVLDVEDYCSPFYQSIVRSKLEEFEEGCRRHNVNKISPNSKYINYNNCRIGTVESENVLDAINNFF